MVAEVAADQKQPLAADKEESMVLRGGLWEEEEEKEWAR